jgi:hypothetical protein
VSYGCCRGGLSLATTINGMKAEERKSPLFVRQDSRTSAALNRQGRPSEDFCSYADAYWRAAQTLFRQHFTPMTKDDLDALPIAFMYRHAAVRVLAYSFESGGRQSP